MPNVETCRPLLRLLRCTLVAALFTSHASAQQARTEDPAGAAQEASDGHQDAKQDREESQKIKDLSLEDLLNVHIRVASAKGDDIFTAPSTVSVIDAATLRRYNIESIGEALDLLPGVSVGRTYYRSNVETIRGVLGDQYASSALILINGVPTWHATTGEGIFSRIAIQDVERIEVLRGPASVIYGTNAFAGAVNIVLKSTARRGVQLDTGVGDQGGNVGVNASIGGSGGPSFFLSAYAGKRTGATWTFVDENNVSGPIRDFQDERMLTFTLQSSRHTVLANVFRSGDSFLGTRNTFASGAGHDLVSNGTLLSYSYTRPFSARADLTAGVVYDENQTDHSRSADDLAAGELAGYRTSAFVKSSVKIGSRLTVDVGMDYDFRKSLHYSDYQRDTGAVLFDNNLANRSVYEYSGHAEAKYRVGSRLNLVVGSRLTKNELFGVHVASRVAAIYTPHERQSFKLFWGQSFRAPTLYELYRESQSGGSFGNVHLDPETSDSLEAAYITSFRKVLLQVSGYHSRYDDKINRVRRYPDFVSDPADDSQIYSNTGRFNANGAELQVTYDVPRMVNAFVNVGYVRGDRGDALNGSNDYNFRYIPEGSVSAGVSKHVHDVSAAVVTTWVQATNGFSAPVPGYLDMNITLGYEQRVGAARLKHSLFAKGLLDSDAQTPEYLRAASVNSLPLGLGPRFGYRLQVSF
jgi:outer membrane receptor protein involved in Fe transport